MDLKFINGKAEIKEGRKLIAKIFDRKVFFKNTKYENSFPNFRYSLEMFGMMKECKTEKEVIENFKKYKDALL